MPASGQGPATRSALSLLLDPPVAEGTPERGVECASTLPPASDPDLVERASRAKAALGDRVLILGHHYQRDEVIAFADVTGDSFRLAQEGAKARAADFLVFCGVHFMAESADILSSPNQQVILPDSSAGCSMADMATLVQVESAWGALASRGLAESTIPITYMNSSAAIKAFVGRNGGAVCTSSNAQHVLRWAFDQAPRVLFLPDQHLGRNTTVRLLGHSLEDAVVFNPHLPSGGLTDQQLSDARTILWRGHCSVHARFTAEAVAETRSRIPGITVMVHPECTHEVVCAADLVGSTEQIIAAVESAPPGSSWAIGTELNLVRRLAQSHPDKKIVFLDRSVCYCSTMNRIDLPHLVYALESLVKGVVVNRVSVDDHTAQDARVALERMLSLA